MRRQEDFARPTPHEDAVASCHDRGYHETLTHAFMWLIDVMISEYGDAPIADGLYDKHAELSDKMVLWFFYSRAHIMSVEAKTRFVEPDLTPLPKTLPTTRG